MYFNNNLHMVIDCQLIFCNGTKFHVNHFCSKIINYCYIMLRIMPILLLN